MLILLIMMILINMMMIILPYSYRKIGGMRSLFDEDYYKPIRTDGSFGGNRNSYIEYTKKIC